MDPAAQPPIVADGKEKNAVTEEFAHINQELYKKNLELEERNKTLSLLRKIDEMMLTKVTDLQQIAQQVVNTIVNELAFKSVAILLYDKKENGLVRLAVSQTEQIIQAELKINQPLFGIKISLLDEENLVVRAVRTRRMQITHGLNKILTPHIPDHEAREAEEIIGITSSFVYPLIVREELIGAMVISINDADGLSEFKNDLIDRLAGVIGIAIDNSLLYQKIEDANRRLKKLDELKDEFVSIASHELRTPMTVIKYYIWLLLQKKAGELTPKQQNYLERTYISTDRLIALVNDMLNISRIESGRLSLDMKPTDVSAVIKDVYNEISPKAVEQGINFVIIPPKQELPLVLADAGRIKQVFFNLIGNSLKFTPKGGTISISTLINQSLVQISVIDTGKGIRKEDAPKLFQKFGIIGGNYLTKQSEQGSGLGLYLSKSLVEMHGGKLWIISEGEGKGTTVGFSLKSYHPEQSSDTHANNVIAARI